MDGFGYGEWKRDDGYSGELTLRSGRFAAVIVPPDMSEGDSWAVQFFDEEDAYAEETFYRMEGLGDGYEARERAERWLGDNAGVLDGWERDDGYSGELTLRGGRYAAVLVPPSMTDGSWEVQFFDEEDALATAFGCTCDAIGGLDTAFEACRLAGEWVSSHGA